MKHFYLLCILNCAFGIILLSGCGKNFAVSGKITFAEDGSPLTCGAVCFESGTNVFRGTIKEDGSYVMSSVQENDGMPLGEYKVFFIGAEQVAGFYPAEAGHNPEPMYLPVIDTAFLSAETSGLSTRIEGKTKDLNFQVRKNPKFPKQVR